MAKLSEVDQKKINARLALITSDEKRLHAAALAEGYKDEVCQKCDVVFLAFHHFVRCDDAGCLMKSKDANGNPNPNLLALMSQGSTPLE